MGKRRPIAPRGTPLHEAIVDVVENVIEETDLTEALTDDQIEELFAAFADEDWAEVDRLIDSYDTTGAYPQDEKAGGADRNRGGAEKLRRYWTVGEGGQKIRWGTGGDWTRCVELVGKHLGVRAKGYCALRHKEMDGYYPGSKLNKSDSTEDVESNSIYAETKQTEDAGEAMLEHKTVGVKGMKVVSQEEGIVETIISVTGMIDNVKDRIMPGAYEKTLAKRKPKGVWSHDWDTPVSKTLDVKELMPGDSELPKKMPNGEPWPSGAGALKVKTQFNLETQRGREAYSDVVFFGEEQEWSIGYNVPVGGAKVDSKTGIREIGMLELYEYSPVLFGAMPLARTTSVKQAQLALKALKQGGAAAWLADAASEEELPVDQQRAEYGSGVKQDDDDEGQDEEKSYISADQMILVKSAIETLSDLLSVVQGEIKAAAPEDDEEEGEDDGDGDTNDGDYGSVAEAVEDMFVDDMAVYDTLIDPATELDDAFIDAENSNLELASNKFLDAVESNMGQSEEIDAKLKEIAEMISDLIDQYADSVGADEKEPVSDDNVATKSDVAQDEAALRDAIAAIGEAEDHDAEKARLIKWANDLGMTHLLPPAWRELSVAGKSLIDTTQLKSLMDALKP